MLSFVDQVSQFTSNLSPPPEYAPWNASDSLFAIWIGVNDVGNAWYRPEWPTLSEQILDRYFEQVQILYDAGARKFAFLTVPPLHRTPAMMAQDEAVRDIEAAAVARYNSLLDAGKRAFEAANPGVWTKIIDTTQSFAFALDNPSFYGIPDATCTNPDGLSCFWTDDYHPGVIIQRSVNAEFVFRVGLS